MKVKLPKVLGYGRLDSIVAAFHHLDKGASDIALDWSSVETISPAGLSILACFFDRCIEMQANLRNSHIPRTLVSIPVVRNIQDINNFHKLPPPSLSNHETLVSIHSGSQNVLDLSFPERINEKFGFRLGEEISFSCRLIINELMQNSLDHSTAERYYLYAGLWNKGNTEEIHCGVMDMGITIPAKIEQKYQSENDKGYLEIALKQGTTTRRQRPGGVGLYLTMEHVKAHGGTLTIVSRDAHLIRYFANRRVVLHKTKFRLNGTWCMTRFPFRR